MTSKVMIPLICLTGCLMYLGFTRAGFHPTISFVAFASAHLFLYYLVFHSFKDKLKAWKPSIVLILISSLFFRLLFLSYPISNDVNRYAWEGKNLWAGYNPYGAEPLNFNEKILRFDLTEENYQVALKFCLAIKTPAANSKNNLAIELNHIIKLEQLILKIPEGLALQEKNQDVANALLAIKKEKIIAGMPKLRRMNRILVEEALPFLKDWVYREVNHKDVRTVYPPLGILFFALVAKVDYSIFAFKVFFIFIDMLTIICLILLVKKFKRPLAWVLMYAWSPLVLMYGIGESHLDVLQVFFFILALLLLFDAKVFTKMAFGFFFLGCAVMTKYLAVIALPFFISVKYWKALPFFILPFLSFLYFMEEGFFDGLILFSSHMHYNDSVAKLMRWLFSTRIYYQLSMLICFVVGFSIFWFFHQQNKLRGIQLSWMWLLLCLPVLHPWYILPIIALSCVYPSRSWFVLTILIGLQFYVEHYQLFNEGAWREFHGIVAFSYSAFLLTIVYGFYHRNWSEVSVYEPPSRLDIVVPVYNEEIKIIGMVDKLLEECEYVKSLPDKNIEISIYIVDGGSTDKTLSKLGAIKFPENISVKSISSTTRGRGNQLYEGFHQGQGDMVLFLHADSQLNFGALVYMVNSFYEDRFLAWGVLGHKYDVERPRLKFIEFLNYIRMSWMGIGFGDQGMFFRRKVLDDIKVPQFPLMEDMEISLRLYKYPTRINLKNGLKGSARRWEKRNFIKSVSLVVYFCVKFIGLRLIGADVQKMSEKMYDKYYSD